MNIRLLLVELTEETWDPEEDEDSDGETGPLNSKLVDILWEERLFAVVDIWT